MNFCSIMSRIINEDPIFLSRILFFDEANFYNNGQVKAQHALLGDGEFLLDSKCFFSSFFISECLAWHFGQSYYRTTFF